MSSYNRNGMSKKHLAIAGAVVLMGASALGSVAAAAEAPSVHVQATRIHVHKERDSSSVFPVDEMSLSYRVSAAGLDLRTKDGAKALEKRVEDAASGACRELGKAYPFSEPNDEECASITARAAMPQVKALVAAAGGTR